MKKIVLILIGLFSTFAIQAQSMYGDQVNFDVKVQYIDSFEEALSQAKAQNKLIFFNCFADWAMPCHAMNKTVFSDADFAKWLNENFVCFITDVTKGNGKTLAKKYNIQTQAHYLVLNGDGEVVHRIVGGSKLEDFKVKVAQALSPKTSLEGTKKMYADGKRDLKFLKLYYSVLRTAEESKEARAILDQIFEKLPQKEWSKKDNWEIFKAQNKSHDDPYFKYLLENKTAFEKSNGKEAVQKQLSDVLTKPLFKLSLSNKEYDSQTLLDLYLLIQKADLPSNDQAYTFYTLAKYRGEQNVQGIIDILSDKLSNGDQNVLRVLDLSLADLKNLTPEDEEILIAYWQKRADSFQDSGARHYQTAIANLSIKTGIKFQDLSFQEALDKAADENKLVFLDCFTTWCGPCKWLDANTFKDKTVGDYFNEKFISIKIDMEKGEGKDLMKRYQVTAFPTLLLLDPQGNEVKRMMGAMDSAKLLNQVKI